jgi:hypothetical protein
VTLAGGSSKLSFSRINIDTSGRANLVSGGIHLFAQRPVYGYGSGSFPRAYREHVRTRKVPVSVSHTEPITIAAEQGVVGLAAYIALLVTALSTLGGGGLLRLRPAGGADLGDRPEEQPHRRGGGSKSVTGPAGRASRRSWPCWSTRWRMRGSSRTRSPGCFSRPASLSRRAESVAKRRLVECPAISAA